jgi:hypothetical protein
LATLRIVADDALKSADFFVKPFATSDHASGEVVGQTPPRIRTE